MEQKQLKRLLQEVANGNISVDDALLNLKKQPFQSLELEFAKLDYHRSVRQGISEIIYGEGKTPKQILEIVKKFLEINQKTILITRLNQKNADFLNENLSCFKYDDVSHIGIVGEIPMPNGIGKILVATAGTSDIPIAEESVLTAQALGNEVVRLYDVGVSGIHRLLSNLDDIMTAQVIIAIAGMDGALPSVIGGLSDCPVIAVPTSVGYGTSFGGISALLSMLNSCSSGVSVVNIDNGFGAGYLASMINHMEVKK